MYLYVNGIAATHCNSLQLTATYCMSLQLTATHCISLHLTASHCNSPGIPDVLRSDWYISVYVNGITATLCKSLQVTATHCNSLQLTATHCNSLQLTANSLQLIAIHYTSYRMYWKVSGTSVYMRMVSQQLTATHCNSLQLAATHTACWCISACVYDTIAHHTAYYLHNFREAYTRNNSLYLCDWHISICVSGITATHCNSLQLTATHLARRMYWIVTSTSVCIWRLSLQLTATHCSSPQLTATLCNANSMLEHQYLLRWVAVSCSELQWVAVSCSYPHRCYKCTLDCTKPTSYSGSLHCTLPT